MHGCMVLTRMKAIQYNLLWATLALIGYLPFMAIFVVRSYIHVYFTANLSNVVTSHYSDKFYSNKHKNCLGLGSQFLRGWGSSDHCTGAWVREAYFTGEGSLRLVYWVFTCTGNFSGGVEIRSEGPLHWVSGEVGWSDRQFLQPQTQIVYIYLWRATTLSSCSIWNI